MGGKVPKARRRAIVPPPQRPIDSVLDKIAEAKMLSDFEEVRRLAETVFPSDWNVRVEPHSQGAFVEIRFVVAHGRDVTDALRKAIDWYRGKARLTIPATPGIKRP